MADNTGAYDQRQALLDATATIKIPDSGNKTPEPTTLVQDVVAAIREQLPQPCPGFWEDHYPGGFKCNECGRLLDIGELDYFERRIATTVLQGTDHYRWP